MKLFAPKYYEKFKCLADRCTHSCCIGWEIDVDKEAICRYGELGEDGIRILSTVDFSGDIPHFMLVENERCPHLREDGLCRIISDLGEKYLCSICREHPRFYNFTGKGVEVGVGASCEAAAELILSSDSYSYIVLIEDDGEIEACERNGADFFGKRSEIYKILSDKSLPYPNRLSLIYDTFSVSPSILSDDEWRSTLSGLEYLSEESRELFMSYSFSADAKYGQLSERALAYFIYRHTGAARSESDFRASLGLALFLERLYTSIVKRAGSYGETVSLLVRLSEEIEYSEDNTETIKNEFLFS